MKRTAYVDFYSTHMVRINTPYIPQKTFDLRQLTDDKVVDLINIKIVDFGQADFFLQPVWGDGSIEDPYILGTYVSDGDDIFAVSSVQEIRRGENVRLVATVK